MPRRNYPKSNNSRAQKSPKHAIYSVPTPDIACQTKRRFSTEELARRDLEIRELQNPGLQLDAYSCPHCRGWHLTSKNGTK